MELPLTNETEYMTEQQKLLNIALSAAHMIAWKRDFATDLISEIMVGSWTSPGLTGALRFTFKDLLGADWLEEARAGGPTSLGLPEGSKFMFKSFVERVHPDDRERLRQAIDQAIATGEPYECEYRILVPGQAARWVKAHGLTYHAADGKPQGLVGVLHDITDRKHSEEMLEEAASRVATILESITDGFLAIDPTGVITYINRNGEDLLGMSRDEIVGRDYHDIFPGVPDSNFHGHLDLAVRSATPVQFTEQDRQRDLWFEVRSRPSDRGVGVYFRDVTESVRAASDRSETRKRQRIFFRDVLRSVSDGKLLLCHSSADLPIRLNKSAAWIPLTQTEGLCEARAQVRNVCQDLSFSEERTQDCVTAISEAAMNTIVHAGGGLCRLCWSDSALQAWIDDKGKGIDVSNLPKATLEKGYTTAGSFGHGMKLMLHTADRVHLLTGTTGTTVVVEMDTVISLPQWM